MLDQYDVKARLAPGVIALAPLLIPASGFSWKAMAVSGLLVTVGSIALVNLVRSLGKDMEPKLWTSWGGKPTTSCLKFSESVNPIETDRLHQQLSRYTDRHVPTRWEEVQNAEASALLYDSAVEAAIARLRSETTGHLDRELAAYGFWRNSLGIRRFALPLAIIGTGVCVAVLWSRTRPGAGIEGILFATGLNSLLVAFWYFGVREDSVRRSADAYTRALFQAVDLAAEQQP